MVDGDGSECCEEQARSALLHKSHQGRERMWIIEVGKKLRQLVVVRGIASVQQAGARTELVVGLGQAFVCMTSSRIVNCFGKEKCCGKEYA